MKQLLIALCFVLACLDARIAHSKKLEKTDASLIFPTQSAVGMKEVEIKLQIIESLKDDPKKLEQYLKDNHGTAVVGPKGKIYLVDGHHDGVTILLSGVNTMYLEYLADWSDLSPQEFWQKMEDKAWVYLKDQNAKPIKASDLPLELSKTEDFPERTLAWWVRKAGGFKRVKEPFQEFQYANLYRQNMKTDLSTDAKAEESFQRALELTESKKAAELPGYTGKKVKCELKDLIRDILKEG